MLTIAGGIVLGFLALGVIRSLFGGPSRAELLQLEVERNRRAYGDPKIDADELRKS